MLGQASGHDAPWVCRGRALGRAPGKTPRGLVEAGAVGWPPAAATPRPGTRPGRRNALPLCRAAQRRRRSGLLGGCSLDDSHSSITTTRDCRRWPWSSRTSITRLPKIAFCEPRALSGLNPLRSLHASCTDQAASSRISRRRVLTSLCARKSRTFFSSSPTSLHSGRSTSKRSRVTGKPSGGT